MLDARGQLARIGWARRPLLRWDRRSARASLGVVGAALRVKEWDYWGILGPDVFFSTVVAHAGFAGVAWAQLVDLAAGEVVSERIAATPLGAGCIVSDEEADPARFRGLGAEVSIERAAGGDAARARRVRAAFRGFPWQDWLRADLTVHDAPGAGSIALATPLAGGGFFYNHKRGGMVAGGTVRLGARTWTFDPATALATLDWGRGVWPYDTAWIWATGWGRLPDGRMAGVNLGRLGAGPPAPSAPVDENCFFLDGELTKLGPVSFDHDVRDPDRPWRIRAADGRLDLVFTPRLDLARRVNLLVLRSDLHQLLGAFSGSAVTSTGELVPLTGLRGWAEDHRARW